MKKPVAALALLMVLFALGAWIYLSRAPEGPQRRELTLYGNMDVRLASAAFEVAGRIASLSVSEGARVEAPRAAPDLAFAGTRAEDLAAAKARLAALEADLRRAEVNLEDAVLKAPADGVVQNRILEPGDMASPERPVLTLVRTEPLWARVYLAEPDLARLQHGRPARVLGDSFPGRIYPVRHPG